MNRWAPLIGFLAAAAILGVPVGWGIAAGWFCGPGLPVAHK